MLNALERLSVRLPARGPFRHAAHRWTFGRCEVVDITFAEPWTEPTLSIPRVLPLTLTLGLVQGSGIVYTTRGNAEAWWKPTRLSRENYTEKPRR